MTWAPTYNIEAIRNICVCALMHTHMLMHIHIHMYNKYNQRKGDFQLENGEAWEESEGGLFGRE